MNTYRLKLSMRSLSGSHWPADTIWGHLCWLIVWRYGEERLRAWLERYKQGDPPLIISDGFPGDLLPRPLFLPPLPASKTRTEKVQQAKHRKQLKHLNWITPEQFARIRSGDAFTLMIDENSSVAKESVTFKNQISRLTGTTGEEGQLYPLVEYPWKEVTIYARITDGERNMVETLLDDMQQLGYGRDKSTGYGEIALWTLEEFHEFDDFDGANAFLSLSHFVPAQYDPTDGKWNLRMKYGKLGGEWANAPRPFKSPLLMLQPGSWFWTNTPEQQWYGRLVDGISPSRPEVVQYGFAFAVPMRVDREIYSAPA